VNNGERKFVEYMYGLSGNFYTSLFNAMQVADSDNLDKLKKSISRRSRCSI
jgi:hypothetical protein